MRIVEYEVTTRLQDGSTTARDWTLYVFDEADNQILRSLYLFLYLRNSKAGLVHKVA